MSDNILPPSTDVSPKIDAHSEERADGVSTDDDWTLNTEQMLFMMAHNNEIETAFEVDDMQYFKTLVASDEYQSLFGEMSFDEAFDRYESMLEEDSGDS